MELRGIALNPLRAILRAEIDQPLLLENLGDETAGVKAGTNSS